MEIRPAQSTEAGSLTKIAQSAKAYWGYPAAWLHEWRDLLTITPHFIEANETFAAVVEGEIVGFYSLLVHEGTLRLEHLWVAPEQIRRGIGRQLFEHAGGRARAHGAPSLIVEADPNAETFYRHMGAVKIGAITTTIEGHPRELPLLSLDLIKPLDPGENS